MPSKLTLICEFKNTELKKIASEINAKKGSQQTLPTLETLIRHTSYLFVNSHPLLDFTRPVPEKVKFVGGIVDGTGAELSPEESLNEVSEIRPSQVSHLQHNLIIALSHSHIKVSPGPDTICTIHISWSLPILY